MGKKLSFALQKRYLLLSSPDLEIKEYIYLLAIEYIMVTREREKKSLCCLSLCRAAEVYNVN